MNCGTRLAENGTASIGACAYVAELNFGTGFPHSELWRGLVTAGAEFIRRLKSKQSHG
jgi:hypothetical protein